jgi:hypothetical protein
MYRLTVHVTNEKKVINENKQGEKKEVLYNTISHRNIKSQIDVLECLEKIKKNHTIQKGNDYRKKDKYNKELIYIRNEN